MNLLIAEWYAGERTQDFLREADASRLAAQARGQAPRRRSLPPRSLQPIAWFRLHVRHATA